MATGTVTNDEGGDPKHRSTEVVEMGGDWDFQLLVDGEDVYGYVLLSTYNTSVNNVDEMRIDDHEFWPFKVKTPVNIGEKTFAGSDLVIEFSYTEELNDTTDSRSVSNSYYNEWPNNFRCRHNNWWKSFS